MNDTLRYLQGLFNVKKYIHENKLIEKSPDNILDYQKFDLLLKKAEVLLERSKYNKVDLKSVFAFMGK